MVVWACVLDVHNYGGDLSGFQHYGYGQTTKLPSISKPDQNNTSTDGGKCAEETLDPGVRLGSDGRVIYTTVPIDPRVVNPHAYIKNLPPLESLRKRRRRFALPPHTRATPPYCLVLDLDETLVHCSISQKDGAAFSIQVEMDGVDHTVHVRTRPHFKRFMDQVSKMFEVILYTASERSYADKIIDRLDPDKKYIKHRLFREHCMLVKGNYVKDLTILRRDLRKTIIVDNSPMAFGYHLENGVPIDSWYSDPDDRALWTLLPFLEHLVTVDDVRPRIVNKYKLWAKLEDFYA